MKRVAIVLSLAVPALAASAASAARTSLRPSLSLPAANAHVTVTPRAGKPSTRFAVRFHNPYRTGRQGFLHAWEIASVADRTQTGRCTSRMALRLAPAGAEQTMRFTLAPPGRSWCRGRYSGTITLYRQSGCVGPPTVMPNVIACPEAVPAPVTVARFSFRVRRPAP